MKIARPAPPSGTTCAARAAPPLWLLAGLLLLGAGCAAASTPGQQAPPQLHEPFADRAGACRRIEAPTELPAAGALVDTAALAPAARALWREGSLPPGQVLLAMEYDGEGVNIRREVLEHSTRELVADSLQKLVFAHRLPQEETGELWGVRLHLAIDSTAVRYQLAHQEYCPPRPRDPRMEASLYYGALDAATRTRGGVREQTIWLRAHIHPAGYVARAQILRGASPGGTLERQLYDFVRQYSFFPATRDGRPVAGSIDIPVRVRGL